MGTSDSHEYQGRPRIPNKQKTLTTDDPNWDRSVAEYADACIKSMSRPVQSAQRVKPVEPITHEIVDRAAEIGDRLATVADRHPPYGQDATRSQRELRLILDEVFGDELGSTRVDALLRQCAAKAVSRWLQHEGLEETGLQESVDLDYILADPLGAIAPDLVEDADTVELLLDEFHAELLVELVQAVGGESMFPGLTFAKLLWALYRWALDRIVRTRPGTRGRLHDRSSRPPTARERKRTVIDELLDPDTQTTIETGYEEHRND